jgi:hypothetical protein
MVQNMSFEISEKIDAEKWTNFSNKTQIDYSYGYREPSVLYIFLITSALSIIDLITLGGNLLVVFAVLKTKALHTVTNHLIMSLAVADMLVAIFVMPFSIYMVIYDRWFFGRIVCVFWISCDVLLCTVSIS